MYIYQITINDEILGSIKTDFTRERTQNLFEIYQNDIPENKIPNMDDFIEWLNENHYTDAVRFYFDDEIIL